MYWDDSKHLAKSKNLSGNPDTESLKIDATH